jgi:hypothetical protein
MQLVNVSMNDKEVLDVIQPSDGKSSNMFSGQLDSA